MLSAKILPLQVRDNPICLEVFAISSPLDAKAFILLAMAPVVNMAAVLAIKPRNLPIESDIAPPNDLLTLFPNSETRLSILLTGPVILSTALNIALIVGFATSYSFHHFIFLFNQPYSSVVPIIYR
jgi:hypothetical protein